MIWFYVIAIDSTRPIRLCSEAKVSTERAHRKHSGRAAQGVVWWVKVTVLEGYPDPAKLESGPEMICALGFGFRVCRPLWELNKELRKPGSPKYNGCFLKNSVDGFICEGWWLEV